MSVISEAQKLHTGALVSLYELDCSSIGGDKFYFHNERSLSGANILWQGIPYIAFPIQAEGFESSQGKELPRPVVTVANVSGVISSLLLDWDDLIGVNSLDEGHLSNILTTEHILILISRSQMRYGQLAEKPQKIMCKLRLSCVLRLT